MSLKYTHWIEPAQVEKNPPGLLFNSLLSRMNESIEIKSRHIPSLSIAVMITVGFGFHIHSSLLAHYHVNVVTAVNESD